MSRHGMPFLILNLGVEMIFVLHSRLRAQAVPPDKAEGVMRDIGSNLFSSTFITELFTPQQLYAPSSLMQVFASLSNSSVMHLSENSMKKLYDLVFMTVKYQVLTLRHPLELLDFTLTHLETAVELLPTSVHPLAVEAIDKVHRLAKALNMGDWATLRRALLNFFGGRHIRVSVFLENNVQNSATGGFYIPKDAYLSPAPSCRPPGVVHVAGAVAAGHFEHPDADLPYPPNVPVGQWDPTNRRTRVTTKGFNMYGASNASGPFSSLSVAANVGGNFADPLGRQTREMPLPHHAGPRTNFTVNNNNGNYPHSTYGVSSDVSAFSQAEQQRSYDAEISYLAKIAGATHRAPGVQMFELELFEEPTTSTTARTTSTMAKTTTSPLLSRLSSSATPATGHASPPAPELPLSRMTASAVEKQNKRLLEIMRDFDKSVNRGSSGNVGSAKGHTSGENLRTGNDLLDMMDEI